MQPRTRMKRKKEESKQNEKNGENLIKEGRRGRVQNLYENAKNVTNENAKARRLRKRDNSAKLKCKNVEEC